MTEKEGSGQLAAGAMAHGDLRPLRAWRRPTSALRLRLVLNEVAIERYPKMPSPPSDDRSSSAGMFDRSLQAQLGQQLKSIFQDIADEPVPQRFIDLLESLAAKETAQPEANRVNGKEAPDRSEQAQSSDDEEEAIE